MLGKHKIRNTKELLNDQNINDLLIEVDDDTREKLQQTIMKMYLDVLCVCKKYNIVPYLIGGSALGSIRHKGFIPWDDDIDVGMTRKDYNKFVRVFNKELSDKYIINAPNISKCAKTRFTKIYKKGTVCREISDKKNSLNGIFLDIFVIENIPRNEVLRAIKGFYCNALQFISSQVYFYENNNLIQKEVFTRIGIISYYYRLIIGFLFSFRSSSKWFDSVDKMARYKRTGLFGIVTGRKHYFGEIFEGKTLFPVRYADYCGIKAPVFNDIDAYLSNLYGDYMKIPPEEKRERHYLVELIFGDEQ